MTQSTRWFWLAIITIFVFLLYLLAPILLPFISAALLAYLGDPLVDRLEKTRLTRTLSVVVVFLLLFAVLGPLMVFLITLLKEQLGSFLIRMPDYLDWLVTNLQPTVQTKLGVTLPTLEVEQLKETFIKEWVNAGGFIKGLIRTISHSGLVVAGWLANIILIPVITFYLLRDWDHLVKYLHDILPRSIESKVVQLAQESDEVLGAFLRGQMLVMLALGIIYSIGLSIVGVEFSLLIGLFAGLLSFIPYMGLIIGVLIAGVAVLFQTGELISLFWVFFVFGIAQMIEGMFLTPILVGDRIGLHPVAVIFAVLAGGQLFGFFGILLALPVFAVLAVLLRHAHKKYKGSKIYQT
ncbi:MAG TPA: AI-2E family transporter [Leucothrix mucor]|uniref:AI-2E family transporter n=1 Tax=Leucothrix mucor TaxID=45248 RepID=A0A7V2WVS1_LEUMU|nr:AI-2E family transporter [Leucothrix mucor]